MSVTITISPGLQRLLKSGKGDVKQLISLILNDITLQTERIIKQKGYAPRAKGHLAASHQSKLDQQLQKQIINNLRVKNGKYLWDLITTGHPVLTTEKSRKWWFWHLKNELGGKYERKTSGPKGQVPPDDYIQRAIKTLISSGYVQNIVRNRVKQFLSGGI